MLRRMLLGAVVLGGLLLTVLALVSASRSAPEPLALISLSLVLVALVIAIGGLWVRRTESVLTIMLILLYLVPQNYVLVGPLRSVGNPAILAGMFALVLWSSGRLLGLVTPEHDHPARWVVMLYVLGAATAMAAGMMRPLTHSESSGATRALFPIAAVVGIALLACDGLTRRRQVEVLIQRLVFIGAVAALIGMAEFLLPGFNYRTLAHLPGLTTNTELISDSRSGFQRVMGAASHPIEYSVALAALAPLALHLAHHAHTRTMRRLNLLALVALVAVTPMTVSRSGVVCLAVGIAWYMVHLSARARLNVAVIGIIGLGVMRSAIPGLLGTIRSLLLIGDQDPSIRARTIDYAKIPQLMEGHWAFGRGWGTFQPDQYFFLDNQYLGSLLEGGVVGLTIFLAVLIVGMGLARGARKAATSASIRGLGQAMSASIAALAVGAATFDEASFRQTAFLLFLLVGCSGALWSIVRRDSIARAGARSVPAPSDVAQLSHAHA